MASGVTNGSSFLSERRKCVSLDWPQSSSAILRGNVHAIIFKGNVIRSTGVRVRVRFWGSYRENVKNGFALRLKRQLECNSEGYTERAHSWRSIESAWFASSSRLVSTIGRARGRFWGSYTEYRWLARIEVQFWGSNGISESVGSKRNQEKKHAFLVNDQ